MVTTRARAQRQRQLRLADLPDGFLEDALSRLNYRDLYHCMLACKKFAALSRAPSSKIWGQVSLRRVELDPIEVAEASLARLAGFVGWLRPRAGGVRVAEIDVMLTVDTAENIAGTAWSLVREALDLLSPCVEVLRLLWGTHLVPGDYITRMPNLREADLVAARIDLGANLTDAQQLRDLWLGASEISFRQPACLPPRLSSLSFFHSRLTCLPPGLGTLTNLRCLDLTQNQTLSPDSYSPLSELRHLQELCASWCNLPSLPAALSALSDLRVLYLHSNFSQPGQQPSEAEWTAALGGMSRLGMLSVSACRMEVVPMVVAGMTSLRCLHVEDNPDIRLPPGAYMASLLELSIDWSTLLSHHAVLRRATALTKLFCCSHHTGDSGPAPSADAMATWEPPAALGSLLALPRLASFVDVLPQTRTSYVYGSVAALMYRLPRLLPKLNIDVLVGENYGWRLQDVLDLEKREGRTQQE